MIFIGLHPLRFCIGARIAFYSDGCHHTHQQNADALVILAGGLQLVDAAASLFPLVQPQSVILRPGAGDVEAAQNILISARVPPERILPITTATAIRESAT